jgi:hypothetical protein
MALTTTASAEPRSFSLGPVKMQVIDYSAASGDTSGTITADRLSSVIEVVAISGRLATASFTISGNTVTLTFSDPLATVSGSITLLGK